MLLSDVYSGPCVLNTKVVNVGVVGGGPVLWKSPGEKAVLYNIMTHGFTVYGVFLILAQIHCVNPFRYIVYNKSLILECCIGFAVFLLVYFYFFIFFPFSLNLSIKLLLLILSFISICSSILVFVFSLP